MDKKGIDLAAALAGQINRDLQDVPNRAPIDPREFLRGAGVPMNTPPSTPVRNYPGMIEPPKATPAGSEVIGVETPMPNLIPMPEGYEKYVEDIPEVVPTPAPTLAPTPAPTMVQSIPTVQLEVIRQSVKEIHDRLDRIEQFIYKRDKYWSKSKNNKSKKKVVKHETTPPPIPGAVEAARAASESETQTT